MAKNQKMTDKSAKEIMDITKSDVDKFFSMADEFISKQKEREATKKAKKMAYGGAVDSSNCRGMGAAIRGGSFKGTF
jgi:hypothetical protein